MLRTINFNDAAMRLDGIQLTCTISNPYLLNLSHGGQERKGLLARKPSNLKETKPPSAVALNAKRKKKQRFKRRGPEKGKEKQRGA